MADKKKGGRGKKSPSMMHSRKEKSRMMKGKRKMMR